MMGKLKNVVRRWLAEDAPHGQAAGRTCLACGTGNGADARYCDQCGAPLSSAGLATRRLDADQLAYEPAWIDADGYRIALHSREDSIVFDNGASPPRQVRSVRFNVEYANETKAPLRYTINQWLLYDEDGYSYEAELRVQFFADHASRRLQEGLINPGRRVRGWIAFSPPESAAPGYVQFRVNYGAAKAYDLPLPPLRDGDSNR